jgi:type II secretory pathway pseudopilin PulG
MTLVEVMVAMAIIAIVAVMCVSAFMMVLGSEMRETNTRLASEKTEERIATGAEPTTTAGGFEIEIGGYTIPSEVHTYTETVGTDAAIATENGQIDTSGSRSYSVLRGEEPEPEPEPFALYFGDLAGADPNVVGEVTTISAPTVHSFGQSNSEETPGIGVVVLPATGSGETKGINVGSVGGKGTYVVPETGYYRFEVWGADGGQSQVVTSPDQNGRGGYAAGTVELSAGETVYLTVGGAGAGAVDKSALNKGGYNGGGLAHNSSIDNYTRASGGGATDVRVVSDDVNNRILVAGGAGGNSGHDIACIGGDGGGKQGGYGYYPYQILIGASQTAGGVSQSYGDTKNNFKASFGMGGRRKAAANSGGGGGWYGGGNSNGASGGSGFVLEDTEDVENTLTEIAQDRVVTYTDPIYSYSQTYPSENYFSGSDYTEYYMTDTANVRIDDTTVSRPGELIRNFGRPYAYGDDDKLARGGLVRITFQG